jgi:hypothetical protein
MSHAGYAAASVFGRQDVIYVKNNFVKNPDGENYFSSG